MTSHKTASLMFGLAVLLYSSESLTAADEKQQVAPKLTFLVIYRPGPRLVGRKVDFGTTAEGAWNVHAGSVRPRLDEACRTNDGQRRWSSGIGSYRRVSSQSDCSGGSSGEVRDLYMRNASVGIEGMGQLCEEG